MRPLQSFAHNVRTSLHAESCTVFLVKFEKENRVLKLVSEDCDSGYRFPDPPACFPLRAGKGCGLTSYLAMSGRILRLHGKELRDHPYRKGDQALHLADKTDYSLLSFPLKNRKGMLVGLVKVQSKKDVRGRPNHRGRFNDLDVALAAFLSTRLAVAQNSHEYVGLFKMLIQGKDAQDNIAQFEAQTLEKALNLVGADRGSIAVWDEAERALIVKAQLGGGLVGVGNVVPPVSAMNSV